MSHRTWNARQAERRRGLFRVAAYFSFVTFVCGLVSLRHARAEVRDQSLIFGRQMLELARASKHDVTRITFNGQVVHVGTSVTSDSSEDVLRRYAEYCDSNRGQSADEFAALGKDAGTPASHASARADRSAIAKAADVRAKNDDAGVVVCFVKGEGTKATTAAAIDSFLSTGTLGAFGELRYAYASKSPSGKTLVLTVWTDATFNLRDMVAEEGHDCPGQDFPEIPRLPSSQRVMSATADGVPYGVNVYKTSATPAAALAHFDRAMHAAGWLTYDPESDDGVVGHAYMKAGVVLTLGTSIETDGTFVAVGLAGVTADDRQGGS